MRRLLSPPLFFPLPLLSLGVNVNPRECLVGFQLQNFRVKTDPELDQNSSHQFGLTVGCILNWVDS